jgi:Ca2+-binding RTX toxin-like protein
VPLPGVDTLTGGNGNDKFHVRDGEADVITCGDGNDTVLADTLDVISDATEGNVNGSCEKVVRSTVPDNAAPENATQAPKEDSKQS